MSPSQDESRNDGLLWALGQIANGDGGAGDGERALDLLGCAACDMTRSQWLISSSGYEIEVQAHACIEHERLLNTDDASLNRLTVVADFHLSPLARHCKCVTHREPSDNPSENNEHEQLITHRRTAPHASTQPPLCILGRWTRSTTGQTPTPSEM